MTVTYGSEYQKVKYPDQTIFMIDIACLLENEKSSHILEIVFWQF